MSLVASANGGGRPLSFFLIAVSCSGGALHAASLLRPASLVARAAFGIVDLTFHWRRLRGRGARLIHRGQALLDEFLDVAQERPLRGIAERNRDTSGARTRRTADTVHIAFGNVRQLEI